LRICRLNASRRFQRRPLRPVVSRRSYLP